MVAKPLYAGRRFAIGVAAYLAISALQYAAGAERWQLAAIVASDNVQRGLSLSDGRPALLAGASYQFDSGVYAGVWGSTVSNGRTVFRKAAGRYEVNYMAGYARALGDDWDLDVVLLRYEYPDSDAFVDYGYSELSVSVGNLDRLRLGFAASRDATIYTRDGLQQKIPTYALEVVGLHPLNTRLAWLAGAGYMALRDGVDSGYAYVNTGIAAKLGRTEFELQYVTTRDGQRHFGRRLAGPRLVLALMVSF